ncbi:MAG: hypothetical protein MI976_08620 [Pseudomonadales bacterium]|nr:hypothetical protein [Pseudomonadales bacterium]
MSFEKTLSTISVVIASAALAWSAYIWNDDNTKNKIRDWQTVVIFEIIDSSDGVTFDQIRGQYLDKSQQLEGYELQKEDISDGALQRILISLWGRMLVFKDFKGHYHTMKYPKMNEKMYAGSMDEYEKRQKEFEAKQLSKEKMTAAIVRLIDDEAGKYTTDSLIRKVQQLNFSFEDYEIQNTLNELEGSSIIKRNQDKKWVR